MTRSTRMLLGARASALALAVAWAVSPAGAQTFPGGAQATPSYDPAKVSISSGSNVDNITVNSAQAVINWTPPPSSGTIDFLPAGHAMNFSGPVSSFAPYTVLNRVVPGGTVAQAIALNGTVQSDSLGSIWFYSPGGIIAGATSVFNVGSLVLTANDIDTTGGLYGATGEIRFRGAAGSNAAVQIAPGATINALTPGTYVALVAPRVAQGGTINVGGSAAYVAAESADIRINAGLFDITVNAGTTDANGIVHTGDTNGQIASGGGEARRIYMVAVPKNNALTMLLSGNIGYVPAGAAIPDDNGVVLSAGYDLAGGAVATPRNATATADAGFTIGASFWQSVLNGAATGDIAINTGGGARAGFGADVTLSAERSIALLAGQSGGISVAGNMTLTAGVGATGGAISLTSIGGTGSVDLDGSIGIAGGLTLNAFGDGSAGVSGTPTTGADAFGGTIALIANGGTISASTLFANATANGGYGTDRSGNATGGSIALSALSAPPPAGKPGGLLQFAATTLDASASTPTQFAAAPTNGGSGFGGSIALTGAGGVLDLGSVSATAQATGGNAGTGSAGNATGGNISVAISAGTHQWSGFTADVGANPGYSSNGGNFGAAVPGANGIAIDVGGPGSLTLDGFVSLSADATMTGVGAAGAASRAGRISLLAHDGGTLAIGSNLSVSAIARAFAPDFGTTTGLRSPDLFGGTISIGAAGGTFTTPGLQVDASAYAPQGGFGNPAQSGNATGGDVTLFASASGGARGNLTLSNCASFGCFASANGGGGVGPAGSNGTGGTILLYAVDADFSAPGRMTLSATGDGGAPGFSSAGGRSGDGLGGRVTVESRTGATNDATLAFDNLDLIASGTSAATGEGVFFNQGDGGNGTGGTASINLAAGNFTAGQVTADISGTGGSSAVNCPTCPGGGTTPFQAGTGQGGTGNLLVTGGTATIAGVTLRAQGFGGQSGSEGSPPQTAALAGVGRGGTAMLESRDGTLQLDMLTLDAGGFGGSGSGFFDSDGADGGAGFGGTARVQMTAGGTGLVTIANGITLGADGIGGAGSTIAVSTPGLYRAGNGGAGTGGVAEVVLAGGTLTLPSLTLSARGIGGTGGDNGSDGAGGAGGSGTGGTANFAYRNEGHAIGAAVVDASGQGGQAGQARSITGFDATGKPIYAYGTGAGGQGGRGTGGTVNALVDVDPTYASLTISADGIGSIGANGGTGGAGGAGVGGNATLDIAFGTTTVSNALRVTAAGQGGAGGDGYYGAGGRGGDAAGGTATLNVAGASAVLNAGDSAVLAQAQGGAGGLGGLQGLPDVPGASGGNAAGGTALFAIGNGGAASTGVLLVSADATGGAGMPGTAGATGGTGGNGGNATAGTATLQIAGGRLVSGDTRASYRITAIGQGGAGAAGSAASGAGGNGGNGAGGTAAFDASNGDYALGTLDIIADGIGGAAGAGPSAGVAGTGSGGAARFANGDAGLLAPGAQRLIDTLSLHANGDSAGRVLFADTSSAPNGGLTVTGALSLASLGAPVAGFSAIAVSATANQVQVGGDATFDTSGPLSFAFAGGGGVTAAGALTGSSGSTIDMSYTGQPAGVDSLTGNTITLTAPGNVTMTGPGSLRAVNALTITSGGAIGFATGSAINAGTDVTLTGQGINAAGLSAGGQALLDAGTGSLFASNLAVVGSITATGVGINLAGPGAMTIATANAGTGALTLSAGTINATSLVAGGPISATAVGNAQFGNVQSTAGGITISAGAINATTLAAVGPIGATATGNASFGDVQSGTGVTINASGLASFAGGVGGTSIAVTSRDIAIALGATIGTPGVTRNATFTSVGGTTAAGTSAPAYIGGGDVAGAYSLSAAELARVFANDIAIVAPALGSANTPSVFVRALTLGTATLPGGGTLSITTPGSMQVEGTVQLTGRTATGGLALSAGETLAVIAGLGAIDINDGNGGLAGMLTLRGRTIIAATQAAIGDVAAMPTVDARDRRLAQNDGVLSDAGILRAATINANVSDGLFIQNTGSATDFDSRRGFTANNVAITTTGAAQIAINGRLTGTGSSFVTGRHTGPQVSINGALDGRAGGYVIGSKINGCLIGTAGSCVDLNTVLEPHGTIEGQLDPIAAVPRALSLSLIELWDAATQGFPPLIDEPVTGAGNDDLWQRKP
ncbi:histidine kinase [Sphingomonas sp. MMSM20]|uniref:histidine kinase n=1 Tax=Sphingomonas lycopersici TaxID=2951807 RepID=UPI002237B7D9|nr:histidine kinase [Sphingomonas lycopersici]MCW6529028.1 histidine kinase [Sphingomonas lycopersici]